MLLALLPGAAPLRVAPELILPVVLPPLLFAATQRSTAQEFRSQARPILVLAVGLTVATAALVATVAHAAGLPWGPAWVLGAVVAPPDPVAATAVARRLRLPQGLVTILEGEGMFNDATALVLYAVAVEATVNGHVGGALVAERLVVAVLGGIAIGLAVGWLARLALAATKDATAETTLSLAVPFVAYLLAEQVHGSGVLAVLSLGLYLRSYGHQALTSAGWLLGRSVWRYTDHLITSVVFVLIGYELTTVFRAAPPPAGTVRLAALVLLTIVALRLAWMLLAATTQSRLGRNRGDMSSGQRYREHAVAGWAGMRGVVTIATALAVPLSTSAGAAFPDREAITIVGLSCVAATLVTQGLTLAPLIRVLGVGSDADPTEGENALRQRAATAGQRVVLRRLDSGRLHAQAAELATLAYAQQRDWHEGLQTMLAAATDDAAAGSQALADVLADAAEAERATVLDARRRGEVSSEVADSLLADIESRAIRWSP
jgi:CPA1 family monovalent cation:H+ antiporter